MKHALAAVIALCLPLVAQDWRVLPGTQHPPTTASRLAMAFDPVRQRLVCIADVQTAQTPFFVAGELWTFEWNGSRWLRRDTGPAITTNHRRPALAFDPTLARIVRVDDSQAMHAFDGDRWQAVSSGDPAFDDASVCFDAARGVLVAVADDGVYDRVGTTWVLRATVPVQNLGRRACFEPVTGKVLIFGGIGVFPATHDPTTWSYDGTAVTPLSTASSPGGRIHHVMALDPTSNRVVVAGGFQFGPMAGELASVWAFDGTNWLPRPSLPQPMALAVGAEFGGRLHLYGGRAGVSPGSTELLRLEPSGAWTRLPLPTTGRFAAHDPVRSRTVSLDGSRTLEFDGYDWADVGIAFPAAAAVLGMTFAANINRIVAVDGTGTAWTYDGTAWVAAASPVQPPPRTQSGLTYDPVRQRTVLLGGQGATFLADLWEWDGATWTQQPNPPLPPAIYALGWDPIGQRLCAATRNSVASASSFHIRTAGVWNVAGGMPLPTPLVSLQLATGPQGLIGSGLVNTAFSGAQDFTFRLFGNDLVAIAADLDLAWSDGPLAYHGHRDLVVLHDANNRRDVVLTLRPAVVTVVGTGCSNASAPRLIAANQPQLGTPAVLDVLTEPNRAVFLLADFAGASVPLGGSCTQWLANPFVLAGALSNSGGFVGYGFVVPQAPALRGLSVHHQALVLTANGALFGFGDLSAGLQLQLGD